MPAWSQKVKNPLKANLSISSTQLPIFLVFVFFGFLVFFNERSYYWEKGKHQVDFEENKNSSINISEMERKGIPKTIVNHRQACIVLYAEVAFTQLPTLLISGNVF